MSVHPGPPDGVPHSAIIDADGIVHVTWPLDGGRVAYTRSDRPGWGMDMPRPITWGPVTVVPRPSLLRRLWRRWRARRL